LAQQLGFIQGFIQARFSGGNFHQTSELPQKSVGQVYSSIKNPVSAVIKRAAVIRVS